jgi:phage shock protein A
MSIMTRFIRLWKADLHGVMDQLEDRTLLLSQHLREMEAALAEKTAALGRLTQALKEARLEDERCTRESDRIETDLAAALEKERDDIARFLIRRLKPLQAHQAAIRQHIRQLEDETAEADAALGEQKRQYERLRLRAKSFFRDAESRKGAGEAPGFMREEGFHEPSEEEVEIELIRRKEKIREGRTP